MTGTPHNWTRAELEHIEASRERGESWRSLAERYGKSEGRLRNVLKHWKAVQEANELGLRQRSKWPVD